MAAYPGLSWMKLEIPFSAGLQQQTDDRARPQPFLDICKDVQFDEVGGLQTRYPYAALSNSIFGGGTLSNCRRLAVVNNELCVFTDTALYSWNAQLAKWVLRSTHLAVEVDETPRFVTTGDQVDGDRAELAGTIVYAWTEGTQVYAAAMDKATGSVLVSPTAVSTAIGRPRLVALATKILLFVEASTTLLTVRAIDPAAPGTAIAGAGTTVLATDFNLYYDVVKAGTQDLCVGACRRQTTTSYTAFTVTPALVVTTSTKARTADGPLAVSAIPNGTQTQVVRGSGTNVQGDLLTTSTLADVFTAQAIGTAVGTPINQIAAAHRSVQNGGAFRCYVFWSAQESAVDCTWVSKFNFVDNANTLGTQANFVRHLGVGSRAFDYAGSVYVWLTFAGAPTFSGSGSGSFVSVALQNTYFLHRDDAYLANAKAVAGHGGGFAPSTGRLPGVALTSGSTVYSWCAAERRRFDAGGDGHVGFAARAPVDVAFTFDSNAARRCARLGGSLYVSGGEILQYDGTRLVECGFHIYPWVFAVIDAAAGGSVATGVYAYKETYRYQNAQNESERSTTATTGVVTVTGNSTSIPAPNAPLTATHKTAVPPAVEVWRTAASPVLDAPFYLASSNDPASLTNPNRYLPNDPTASSLPTFNDFLSDASLTLNETNPENGSFLESIAPPPAKIVLASDTRLLLASVAGDPDRVWPSRQRNDGEVASFHDGLPVDIPRAGGSITAIWFQDETMYVSRATALYVLPGDGVDNLGQGQGFGPARIVSLDVGAVSQESVALTPHGTIFLSRKGWQLLDRGGVLQYIGGPVSDYNSETVCSVDVVETQHQVRILTTARMLVWAYPRPDFPGGQWGEWTISDGVHSLMWNGTHVYLTTTGPKQQQATYTALTYGQDVEEAWIKPNGLVGSAKVRRLQPLGEYRSAFLLRMRIAYNYDPTYIDDIVWTPSPTTAGGPLQMMHAPSRPRCESIKVRLTAVTDLVRATLATAPLSVTTSGTDWTATWTAGASLPGELGNALTMTLAFEDFHDIPGETAPSIAVRDNMLFNTGDGRGEWLAAPRNLGVRVLLDQGTPLSNPTIAQLEAAIVAGTMLATLTSADATPGKKLSSLLVGSFITGTFASGAFGAPTGEALKLTGLGLEVGIEKANLYTGLARAQKA